MALCRLAPSCSCKKQMCLLLMQEVDGSACRALRRVFVSGEALPPTSVAKFLEQLPLAQLHNLYGPTEATVDVTGQTRLCSSSDSAIQTKLCPSCALDQNASPAPRACGHVTHSVLCTTIPAMKHD